MRSEDWGKTPLMAMPPTRIWKCYARRLLLLWAKTWAFSIVKTTKISIPMQPSKGKVTRSVSELSNSRKRFVL
jgi:hypothetical protein